MSLSQHCSSFLGLRGGKSLSPYSTVSVSPTSRLSTSNGVTNRKKNVRSLMSVSNDSEGHGHTHSGHLSMHTNTSQKSLGDKNGPRSPAGKRVQHSHSVVAHRIEDINNSDSDSRGSSKCSWALSLAAFIIGLVLCLHIDRTQRQWEVVTQKLDSIETLLQALKDQNRYV